MIKVETVQNANLTTIAMNLLDRSVITWNYLLQDATVSRGEYQAICKNVLSLMWMVERFEEAPTDFESLRDVISYKKELNESLDTLLAKEFVLVSRDEVVDEFIQENLDYLRMAVEFLES